MPFFAWGVAAPPRREHACNAYLVGKGDRRRPTFFDQRADFLKTLVEGTLTRVGRVVWRWLYTAVGLNVSAQRASTAQQWISLGQDSDREIYREICSDHTYLYLPAAPISH